MKKLWQKNWNVHKTVELFETADDLIYDNKLVVYDIMGSLAHVKMLHKIGIFTSAELEILYQAFAEILKLHEEGKFKLVFGDEDIHTKIENFITAKYCSIGKKIHTGRSRNDQVLTATRLYSKAKLLEIWKEILIFENILFAFVKSYGQVVMPGYTHMQKAMPLPLSMWAGSYISSFIDDIALLISSYDLIDQSPLGSAAGFGSPLQLDREYTAYLLGFSRVQEVPLYCQNSRGKIEIGITAALLEILLTLNKLTTDILLFTMEEFQYFSLDISLCTGSSMMPQKKNVDVGELLRSKVHIVLGHFNQIAGTVSNLISGYNRDVQDTKKPLIESLEITLASLRVAKLITKGLTPNISIMQQALSPNIFATHEAYNLVKKGYPFRTAYQKVANQIFEGTLNITEIKELQYKLPITLKKAVVRLTRAHEKREKFFIHSKESLLSEREVKK